MNNFMVYFLPTYYLGTFFYILANICNNTITPKILAGNSKPNIVVINLDYDYDKVGSNVILFSNSRRVQQTNLVR